MSEVNMNSLHELCEDKDALLHQLQKWNLIPCTRQCRKCGGNQMLYRDSSRIDGWIWRCQNKTARSKRKTKICGNMLSFRTGTFFARSKLSILKILAFVNLWVENVILLQIQKQANISNHACVDWSSFCHEVLLTHFVDNKTKLGGPGVTVEIYEAKFKKLKYDKGHRFHGQWVFGGYERGTARIFMVPVENRGADTLIPVIEQWIQPGTTIMSDYWKSYKCLGSKGYIHLKRNHSVKFKDPDRPNTTPSGLKVTHRPDTLARSMFFKKCTDLKLNRTEEFFRLAGEVYDGSAPVLEEPKHNDMDIEDSDVNSDSIPDNISKINNSIEDEAKENNENISDNTEHNKAQEDYVIKEVLHENEIEYELVDDIVKEEPEDNFDFIVDGTKLDQKLVVFKEMFAKENNKMQYTNISDNTENNEAQEDYVIKEQVIKCKLFDDIVKEEPEDNFDFIVDETKQKPGILREILTREKNKMEYTNISDNTEHNKAQGDHVIKEEVLDRNKIKYELLDIIIKEESDETKLVPVVLREILAKENNKMEYTNISDNTEHNNTQEDYVIKEEVLDGNRIKYELLDIIIKEEPDETKLEPVVLREILAKENNKMEYTNISDNTENNKAQEVYVIKEEVLDEDKITYELVDDIVKEEPEANCDIIDIKSELQNDAFLKETDKHEDSTSKNSPRRTDKKSRTHCHTGVKRYKCDVCDKKFINKNHLMYHTRCHTGERPYKCDVCDKTFNYSWSLVAHKRCHTGEKPFKCDVCDKAFTASTTLVRHKLCHTGERHYKCDVCDKTFSHNGSLVAHIRCHTGEKPFKCDVCDKTFALSTTLVRHKLCHTGDKPYKCDICNKAFNRRSHVSRHILIHSGTKPYKCDICAKTFNQSCNLIKHKLSHR